MGVEREALIFTLIVLAAMLPMKFFIGETDIWGPYYYRHADTAYRLGTTLYTDELSYLGRDFTYPPAYFMFASQMSSILFAPSADSVRIPLHILVMGFSLFTTYLLFEGFERRQRILASLLLTFYTFYFITNITITLHTLSFGLVNSSVILFRRKGRAQAALGVMALAVSFATHPVSLFQFPVLVYATTGLAVDVKKAIRTAGFALGAVILSLPLYLPIFLKSGLPYEIIPNTWGYLHSFGLEGMYFDMLFIFPLFLVAIAFGIARKQYLNCVLLLLLFLASAYLSFRADILLATFLAGFLPFLLKDELKDRALFLILSGAACLNLLVLPVIYSGVTDYCSWGSANHFCISPMEYIAKHTPTESRVAVDPEFGHLEAYYGKRPVLADLYVEYADWRKYDAEARFFYELNESALSPYGINVMVLDRKWGIERDLNDSDRVYDNGYVQVFRNG